jgi:hypothetical protein
MLLNVAAVRSHSRVFVSTLHVWFLSPTCWLDSAAANISRTDLQYPGAGGVIWFTSAPFWARGLSRYVRAMNNTRVSIVSRIVRGKGYIVHGTPQNSGWDS